MISVQNNGTRWLLEGDILMQTANSFLTQSKGLFSQSNVTVDFSQVGEVDTAAVSLMLEWQRMAVATGIAITFTNLPTNLLSLATLYGVEGFIPQAA